MNAFRFLSRADPRRGKGGEIRRTTVEPPLTDPPRCGQPLYNGQHDKHRLILACVPYIFNLRETDNCNLYVPDNGHPARPRMIVALQKSL